MDIKLFELSQNLKNEMNNDSRFILLNKLEKEISNNEEIMALAYKKDVASTYYSDLLKIYKDDSKEVELARKNLYEAKKALDSYPLIVEYNKAYSEVKKIFDNINSLLFKDFSGHML